MADSVPVQCPECLRTQGYAAPALPCACGHPVVPPVIAGALAEPLTHRTWAEDWVTVRCGACGREGDWPHPELGCACGTVLRVPVHPMERGLPGTGRGLPAGERDLPDAGRRLPDAGRGLPADLGPAGGGEGSERPPAPSASDDGAGSSEHGPGAFPVGGDPAVPALPAPAPHGSAGRHPAHGPSSSTGARPAPTRGAFRPVTIRTARDAVAAAAGYLRWLGFRELVQPEERPPSGIDLRGAGIVAQVDPSTRPAGLRAVECLWLNGLNSSAVSVFFSLAGYTPEARARAAEIDLPLFVLDLTGTPQPVNLAADELAAGGA